MNTKTLVAAVAGGLTLFLTGFIFYELLLADFFATSVAKDPLSFPFIVLGEVVFGFLLAWVFGRSGTSTLADGAKDGAMIGFLIALAYGSILYGATTIADLSYYVADAVVWAVRFGAAGAVVGWYFGRSESTAEN